MFLMIKAAHHQKANSNSSIKQQNNGNRLKTNIETQMMLQLLYQTIYENVKKNETLRPK